MHSNVPPSPLSQTVPAALFEQSEVLTQPRHAPVVRSHTPTEHAPPSDVQLEVQPIGGLHTVPAGHVAAAPMVQTHEPLAPPSSAHTSPCGLPAHSVLVVQAAHSPVVEMQTRPSDSQFGPPSWSQSGRHSPPSLGPMPTLHFVPVGQAPASTTQPQPSSTPPSVPLNRVTSHVGASAPHWALLLQ
jgi:hypothetical protein